jgi:transcriptional regulator of acetoin/glycerol metabolism|nr:sigma 54-interacting transcriptional regulator [Kofleriaceae bacterium]
MADTVTSVSDSRDGIGQRAAAQLVVALECDRPLAGSTRHLLEGTAEVRIGRGDRRAVRSVDAGVRRLELAIPDRNMSTAHARLVAVRGRWVLDDAGSKNGCLVNGAAVDRAVLLDGDLIELGHTLLLYRDAVAVAEPARPDFDGATGLAPTFVAELARSLSALAKVARGTVAATIVGARGGGHQTIARALHAASGRAGAFVVVPCGPLAPALDGATLIELLRSADRGTLLIDDLGALPRDAQTVLLRVLERQVVLPAGSARPIAVTVRVVAASPRPLDDRVDAGELDRDLAARMSELAVTVPSLAERVVDLGLLIGAALRTHAGAPPPAIAVRAARALFRHAWPLDVSELDRALSTALALSERGTIRLEHLPEAVRRAGGALDGTPRPAATGHEPLHPETEAQRLRVELVALLEQHAGNVSAVAKTMGKGRMQIHRWLKRFELELASFRK